MTVALDTLANRGTWRWDRGLAYWVYTLPAAAAAVDAPVVMQLRAALASLGDFAVVRAVAWTTEGEGEDALVRRFDAAPAADEVTAGAEALVQIVRASAELELWCVGEDGSLRAVADGAQLDVEREPDGGVTVGFSLHVDLFVPRSWGAQRDNHVLAGHNGPRLDAFLARLRAAVDGTLRSFDAGDYQGQLTPTGVAPVPPG